MLELKNITKIYPAGGEAVQALKGVSMQFREHEFVSILGPSGCGKTTLLNIIGGLDRYTEGDLLINNRSTKQFKDRDWDAYRNHSIGFVFQSYNLIPHQTVLQNVELSLTLSGVGKAERRKRAREALIRVGLHDQMKKRPAEMSGGQMQRVAIARAIVNNPDIILADEPTGALDTETSIQVMEILKEISRDRLVIMVTHNPDLAERYSTRIIRMLDGRLTGDTLPLTEREVREETARLAAVRPADKKEKKPSMSLWTSFGLSLKNLFTKKGRTLLTGFAGSIGIIGIALIYAVSNGATTYIDTVQEETLSSYPLTLEATTVDLSSLMNTFMDKEITREAHENDGVYRKAVIYELINAMNSYDEKQNDLAAFKTYLEAVRADGNSENPLHTAVNAVQYTYDQDLLIYTRNVDGEIIESDTKSLLQGLISGYMGTDLSSVFSYGEDLMMSSSSSSMMTAASRLWQQMLPGENGSLIHPLFEKQYDLIYGTWPNSYDEVLLVVDRHNELPDLALYALGLIPESQIQATMAAAMTRQEITDKTGRWNYEEICGREFRTILPADCFVKDEASGLYVDMRGTDAGLRMLYENGLQLKVVGVVRANEDAVSTMHSGGIVYTSALTQHLIEKGNASEAIQAQLANPETDVLNGLPFREGVNLTDQEKTEAFKAYYKGLNAEEAAALYVTLKSVPDDAQVSAVVDQQLAGMSREELESTVVQAAAAQTGMSAETVSGFLASMSDEELQATMRQAMAEQVRTVMTEQTRARLSAMPAQQLAGMLKMECMTLNSEKGAAYYDAAMTFSDSTLKDTLRTLGYVDPDAPSSINLYASTFEGKDRIEEAIADYNAGVDELSAITYTDYVGLIMSSVTTIINAITYVLIAFVAISLIVSSIMIGVITLISVQERTKEIGILRSIGASKKNVSGMFNAETVIIGFTSGILGIAITWLLCIPINIILHHLTGIGNLSAILDVRMAVILVVISMLLTLVAGIIPSRSAARKDPVVALRTE